MFIKKLLFLFIFIGYNLFAIQNYYVLKTIEINNGMFSSTITINYLCIDEVVYIEKIINNTSNTSSLANYINPKTFNYTLCKDFNNDRK